MTPTKIIIVACAAIAALSHQRVDAVLNIDLRLTGLTGPGVLVSSKEAIDVKPGTVVRFDIFAVVNGANASTGDDKFIGVSGSFDPTSAPAIQFICTATSPPTTWARCSTATARSSLPASTLLGSPRAGR